MNSIIEAPRRLEPVRGFFIAHQAPACTISLAMPTADRNWALKTLGLQPEATPTEIDRAYEDLKAVWIPKQTDPSEAVRAKAADELEDLEKAKSILSGSEAPTRASGLNPIALGVLMAAAFVIGFFVMRSLNKSRAPKPVIVQEPSIDRPSKVALNPPDINVTSEPEPTDKEQQQIDEAIKGLAEGLEAVDARDTLISLGQKSIVATTKALSSDNENVRMNAAMVINAIAAGDDDAPNDQQEIERLRPIFKRAGTLKALEKLTSDPNSETRLNVAFAIGNLQDTDGLDSLTSLKNDEDGEVRAGVAYGLGRLGMPEVVPTLIELLNDDELSVRISAVESMRSYDTPEIKSALAERLPKEVDEDIIARIKSVLENQPSPSSNAR